MDKLNLEASDRLLGYMMINYTSGSKNPPLLGARDIQAVLYISTV